MSDPARKADGAAVLKDGLAAAPQAGELKWAEASQLESEGNVDGAIKIYDALYQENSRQPDHRRQSGLPCRTTTRMPTA
ncbi:MAG: hypothetical protein U1E48_11390 [Paracoccaceae bacterium]